MWSKKYHISLIYFIVSAARRRRRCLEPRPGSDPSEVVFLWVSQTFEENPRCSVSSILLNLLHWRTQLLPLSPCFPLLMPLSCRYPPSCGSHTVGAVSGVQCLCMRCCSVSVLRSWAAPHTSHRARSAYAVTLWQNHKQMTQERMPCILFPVSSKDCSNLTFTVCSCSLQFYRWQEMTLVLQTLLCFGELFSNQWETQLWIPVYWIFFVCSGQYGWPPVSWELYRDFR